MHSGHWPGTDLSHYWRQRTQPNLFVTNCGGYGLYEFDMDLGLVRDVENPMDKPVRKESDMISEMFRQSEQAEATGQDDKGVQTKLKTSNGESTARVPPLAHSVLPRPRVILVGLIVISRAV
ncbi:hypothetical protein FXO38_16395 [Capsicum annuum]|nr:hypothetical protein FXO38_16395 [Capsicum annuum]